MGQEGWMVSGEGVLHVTFSSPLPPPVSSCLRDLRSEALVFMAGIVKHITTVKGGGGGVTPIDPVLPPATGVKTLVKWPR